MIFRYFTVKILSEGKKPKEFKVNSNPLYIGRSMECHISFSGNGVSRRHLKVEFTEGRIYIKDLDSRNGTFLDDSLIGADVIPYKTGSRVCLGNSEEEIVISVEQGVPKLKKSNRGNGLKKVTKKDTDLPSALIESGSEIGGGISRDGLDHNFEDQSKEFYHDQSIDPDDMEIVKFDRKKDSFSEIKHMKSQVKQKLNGSGQVSLIEPKLKKKQKQLELIKDELSIVQEELRNAKAKLNQKLKVIDLEIQTRKLTMESEFQKEKNEKEMKILELEKEITIKKSQLDLLDHKIKDIPQNRKFALPKDPPDLPIMDQDPEEDAS